MESVESTDKSSEGSACAERFESDTNGPSSTSGGSEIKAQKDFLIHKVTKFDTLAGLAIRYGLSVYDLQKANGLVSDRAIYARETLVIPLHPLSSDQGTPMMEKRTNEWMTSSSSKKPPVPKRSQAPTGSSSWMTFMAVDDSRPCTVAEIELEVLDENRSVRQGREERMEWQKNTYSRSTSAYIPSPSAKQGLMQRPTAPAKNSGSFSEYFLAMKTSFIKRTEQLFGVSSSSSALPQSESLFDKIKKVASSSLVYGGEGQGRQTGDRARGVSTQKFSEGNLAPCSKKDESKID